VCGPGVVSGQWADAGCFFDRDKKQG